MTSLLLLPASLHAQVCSGAASYRGGGVAVGASAERTRDANLFLGHVSAGKVAVGFVSANAGSATFDNTDAKSTFIGGRAGYEEPWSMDDRLTVCPIIGASYESGDDGVVRTSALELNLGVSVGGELIVSSRISVIPFAHIAVLRTRIMLRDTDSELETTDVKGHLRLGVGVAINRIVTLQPTIGLPLAVVGGKPAYGVALHVHLRGGG